MTAVQWSSFAKESETQVSHPGNQSCVHAYDTPAYWILVRQLISILSCEKIRFGTTSQDVHWKHFWSHDTTVVCFEGSHAVLSRIFAIPFALIILIGFPISAAVFLIQSKNQSTLDTVKIKEMFGFMLQAYIKKNGFLRFHYSPSKSNHSVNKHIWSAVRDKSIRID